jgi:hypothetical protein
MLSLSSLYFVLKSRRGLQVLRPEHCSRVFAALQQDRKTTVSRARNQRFRYSVNEYPGTTKNAIFLLVVC